MTKEKESPKRLSRREFVKGAAAVAGAGALAGCAPAATPAPDCPPAEECAPCPTPWLPEKWDYEADVVVVGYGGAGAVTAITAHDLGNKVLVLEKAPIEGGGSTRMSTCSAIYTDNATELAKYFYGICFGMTPMETCEAWAEASTRVVGWMDEMGLDYILRDEPNPEYPHLPGASSKYGLSMPGKGPAYFAALDERIKDRGVEVLFDSPAKKLVQNWETGEILGAIAESQGQQIAVKAKKAVVLCCGGFEFNEEMKLNHLSLYPFHYYGWKYNTGDGITMAQEVGAATWHMNVGSGRPGMWFPEYETSFSFRAPKANGYMFVDQRGSRYFNETAHWMGHSSWLKMRDWDLEVPEPVRNPSYMIFDDATRLAGPLSRPDVGICTLPEELGGAPMWSDDNSLEIEKGWVQKGDSIEGLAEAIGADAAVLKATLENFNRYCAEKNDAEFGRDPEKMLPIQGPPYYAVALWPTGAQTNGGPVRNGNAEVMGLDQKPIPRLYSAGELGSVGGILYEGGAAVGETICFGLVAGENASAEEPWK